MRKWLFLYLIPVLSTVMRISCQMGKAWQAQIEDWLKGVKKSFSYIKSSKTFDVTPH